MTNLIEVTLTLIVIGVLYLAFLGFINLVLLTMGYFKGEK